MTQALKMLQRGGLEATAYVDDVFSTYLYTGNGSTQTITNGIDLSTYGGMVWIKERAGADAGSAQHCLIDTERGAGKILYSSLTNAQSTTGSALTAFNANGFSLGTDILTGRTNDNNDIYASWTFRKAAKFFDVVTATAATGASTTVNHNLGVEPGMVIMKATSGAGGQWVVYHRSLGTSKYLYLSATNAEATLSNWISVSSTSITVSDAAMTDGDSYVFYLFAHDTATDGIIQCGSFTTDGSGNATVTLGWEPQFILAKQSNGIDDWRILDSMRGMPTSGLTGYQLRPNLSNAEQSVAPSAASPTATGFTFAYGASSTYIYLAIRRPNKPPTTGTQVFQPTVYTGTNADNHHLDTTIAPDMVWLRQSSDAVFGGMLCASRLTGQEYLATGTTAAAVTAADAMDQQLVSATEYGTAFSSMSGIYIGNNATADINLGTTASDHIALAFKRYPGVFDVVAWTASGTAWTSSHNLGATPEFVISKNRTGTTTYWYVYASSFADLKKYLLLNATDAVATNGTDLWAISSSSVSGYSDTSGGTGVTYLFATKAGISKVGSYTGNGSSQTINCGFSAGARFVLIKRTDSTGDWFVFDTARGIVAGNDPFLRLNSTAAEITTVDALDTDNSGFIVNQDATYNLNVNTATYIFLAFA